MDPAVKRSKKRKKESSSSSSSRSTKRSSSLFYSETGSGGGASAITTAAVTAAGESIDSDDDGVFQPSFVADDGCVYEDYDAEGVIKFVTPPSASLFCPIHRGLFTDPVIAACGHTFCRSCLLGDASLERRMTSSSTPTKKPRSSSSSSSKKRKSVILSESLLSSSSASASAPSSPAPGLLGSAGSSGNGVSAIASSSSGNGASGSPRKVICPLHKEAISNLSVLIPNLAISEQLRALLVYCKFGLKKLEGGVGSSEGAAHQRLQWVVDETGCQTHLRLHERAEHHASCAYAPAKCPHCDNCPPLTRQEMEEHIKHCSKIPCPFGYAGCSYRGSQTEVLEHADRDCALKPISAFIAYADSRWKKQHEQIETLLRENTELRERLAETNGKLQWAIENLELVNLRANSGVETLTSGVQETKKQVAHVMHELGDIRRMITTTNQSSLISRETGAVVKCEATFTGHTGPVWSLTLASDYNTLISGSSDTTVKVWDIASGKCKTTLRGHEGIVHGVGVNGNQIVSGSSDRMIKVWDMQSGKCLRTLEQQDNTVCSVIVAEGFVFTGSFGEIKVWDREYNLVDTLRGHNHWVRALCVSNRMLFTGSYNIIKVYDIRNAFQCTATIRVHCGSIYAIAVGGGRLLAGTYENLIYVWDLETLHCLATLHGHTGAVYNLCVLGSRFFSSSYDTTIRVWNLNTMHCEQTLTEHTSSVEALISAPTGAVFSAAADNTVRMWR